MGNYYGKEYASPQIDAIYTALRTVWKADTCAPRMRAEWNESNPSLGQCSVTAFAVQDLLGGEVYGIPLGDGNFHCFNVIDGRIYDLTSEQFGKALEYTLEYPQSRQAHFSKREKFARYGLLAERLKKALPEER